MTIERISTHDGLSLEGGEGEALLASNRYVLGRPGDLDVLHALPPATLDVEVERGPEEWCLTLANAGGAVAAGIVVSDDRDPAAPGWAIADDGWFDLVPGERRAVRVAWAHDAGPDERRLRVEGWNARPVEVGAR